MNKSIRNLELDCERGDKRFYRFVKLFFFFFFVIFLFIIVNSSVYAATYIVTKTEDTDDGVCDADCSFYEAVDAANSNPEADTINFDIPTSDGGYVAPVGSTQGYFLITQVNGIALTDDNGVFIDGYSQSGSSRNTAVFGEILNAVLKIQIYYSGTYFTLSGNNNHIAGISYKRPERSTIDIYLDGSNNNWIEGNFFGSDITGATSGEGGSIKIANGSASNTVGTNGDGSGDVGERNLFMGSIAWSHSITGYVWADGSANAGDNNIIAGNYFGVDKTGRSCSTATIYGQVIALASSDNRVGTNFDDVSDSEEANIIGCINSATNARGFVRFFGSINDNYIQGNYIGISPYGDALGSLAGTGKGAVSFLSGGVYGNIIKGNTISNGDYGILQLYSGRNTFSQNIIYGNSLLGIKLGSGSTPLPNDAGDTDSGTNDLMNYPVITNIYYIGDGQYQINGTFDGLSSEAPFTIEICLTDNDSSDHGGCISYLGSEITSSSIWTTTVTISGDTGTQSRSFTTTATNANGSTSEFGLNKNEYIVRGGNGMPLAWRNPPKTPVPTSENPQGGFRIIINDSVNKTNSRTVALKLIAGSDSERMAISNTGDFTDAGQEEYQKTKEWDLCSKMSGFIKFPICPDGTYTVYAKFFTHWGRASEVVSDSIILDAILNSKTEKEKIISKTESTHVPEAPSPPTIPKEVSTSPVSASTPIEIKPDTPIFTSTQGNIIIESIVPQKPLKLITGSKLKTSIKPSKPVQAVRVIIIFKKPKESSYLRDNFLSSFVSPAYAQTWQVAEYTLTDKDRDGIFEGEIKLPEIAGEYVIRTTLYYDDGTIEDIETEILIDPKGYVYQSINGKEIRIPDAKISLYRFNPKTNQFELWQAQDYDQENPQTTDKTGEYNFLVPDGKYYLTIIAPDYQDYQSEEFEVKEGDVINRNIELTPIKPIKKFNWQWLIFPIILIIGIIIGIFIRIRKKYK